MKNCLLIIAFCLGNLVSAQAVRPKASFQVNLGLPINMANESFKGIMSGLINGSAHYQYTLRSGYGFGFGLNYSYFQINEFKIASPAFGGMHTPAVFIRLGQEKFHTPNFGTDWGIKFGYAMNFIGTNLNRAKGIDPLMVESTYTEPYFALVLMSDEQSAFKFNFAYGFYGFSFSPYKLGFDSSIGYDPQNFKGSTSYLSVGFSYIHYFRMR